MAVIFRLGGGVAAASFFLVLWQPQQSATRAQKVMILRIDARINREQRPKVKSNPVVPFRMVIGR
jgi:hypothetical protein